MFNRPVSMQRAAANKANAALSTGPRTAQGKSASSHNATSHGLSAASVTVHYWESQEEFDTMRAEYMEIFKPADRAQRDLVDRLVDCTWRRNRGVSMETTLLNLEIGEMSEEVDRKYVESDDGLLRVSLAFLKRHGEGVWDSLTRHITAAERGYQRAMRELRTLQAEAKAEPEAAADAEAQIQLKAKADTNAEPETASETQKTFAKRDSAKRTHPQAGYQPPTTPQTTNDRENPHHECQDEAA